jgi:acyl-CoA thioester hydrolase
LRVRYGECDPQGVVFNANYLAFFDVIITEFWREAIGDYNDMLDAGTDMVVAESRIRFLGPAAFDEEVDFELRVSRLGNTALGTRIDASVGDRPVVAGEMRHVFIDPATKQKCPMPENIRAGLEPYVMAEPAPDGSAPDAAGVRVGGSAPDASGAPGGGSAPDVTGAQGDGPSPGPARAPEGGPTPDAARAQGAAVQTDAHAAAAAHPGGDAGR